MNPFNKQLVRAALRNLPIPWIIALGLVIFALLALTRKPDKPLPFTFETGKSFTTGNRARFMAKLDTSGSEHAVVLENAQNHPTHWDCDIHIWSPNGTFAGTNLISLPGVIQDACARDLDNDGTDEAVITCVSQETFTLHAFAFDLPGFGELWHYSLTTDYRTCGGKEYDNGISVGPLVPKAANGEAGLILAMKAGYCGYPRCMMMLNAQSGDSLWTAYNSTQASGWEIVTKDVNHDQLADLIRPGYAPGNKVEYDGLRDSASQIAAVSRDGRYLWRNVWPYANSGSILARGVNDTSRSAMVLRYCSGSSDAKSYLGRLNLQSGVFIDSIVFEKRCPDYFLLPIFADSICPQEFITSYEPGVAAIFDGELHLKRTAPITGWIREAVDFDGDEVNEFVMADGKLHVLVDSEIQTLAKFGVHVSGIQLQHRGKMPPVWWVETDQGLWRTEIMPNPEFINWKWKYVGRLTIWIFVSLLLAVICVGAILLWKSNKEMAEAEARMIEENRRMAEEKRVNDAQVREAAMVSRHVHHVLANPLGGIKITVTNAVSEIRQQAPILTPTIQKLEDSVLNWLGRCSRSIEVVKKYADPELYKWEDIDLHQLVVRTLEERFANTKGKTEIVDSSQDNSSVIKGDRLQLEELVVCIFTNAQLARDESRAPRFEFSISEQAPASVETESNSIYLQFSDNGKGMSAEESARIFESGYSGWPPEVKGTGFGLAFVKKTVESHGGKVLPVESELGKGTTFTFAFPTGQKAT